MEFFVQINVLSSFLSKINKDIKKAGQLTGFTLIIRNTIDIPLHNLLPLWTV